MKKILLLFSLTLFALPVLAAQYDLYSWNAGTLWAFSLVPAPSQGRSTEEIRTAGGPLLGAAKVKEKFLGMEEKDIVTWQKGSDGAFSMPPGDLVEGLKDYAKTCGVKLIVPAGAETASAEP